MLLGVEPGAVVEEVARAYGRQGAQFAGETQVSRYRWGDASYVRYLPPGGAGGYQAVVWSVDRAGEADYVFYSLVND